MTDEQKEILQAQLNREKATIAELKQVYAQAAKDIEANIQALSARTDMENLQTIIYQKQYQEALKAQVNNILEMLHANEFTTIQDYLTHCYTDGYVGVMYDIMAQGIPVIVPINQELVVKALQTDSKISTTLYKKLGEDVNSLKTSIRAELSRGISQGQTWNQIAAKIAKGMNSNYNKAYNNAVRIARTEGHRVQCQSAYDAQKVAKSKGADVVKQWDSTLDNRTRKHHRMLDGQIREVEEPFEVEGMQAMHPSGFGRASEDVNCRCALLQRARWALDEAELQALKERAEYFGLDKTKDFEDFQRKYLQASELERSSVQKMNDEDARMKLGQTVKITEKVHSSDYGIVDRKLANSSAYHGKFEGLTKHKPVNEAIYQESMRMLEHRDGTPFEDMVAIDARTGKIVESVTDSNIVGKVKLTNAQYEKITGYNGSIILLHNHPNSSRVSYADILALKENNVNAVVAVGHDGSVNIVSELNKEFDIEKFWKEAYNGYQEIYKDDILAEHYATDDLYRLGIFKVESR